jgi:hypothetical protein
MSSIKLKSLYAFFSVLFASLYFLLNLCCIKCAGKIVDHLLLHCVVAS